MNTKLLLHSKLELVIVFCILIIASAASTEVTVWTEAELAAGRTAALDKHNLYRCQHGAPPMKLDPELNQIAQAYAEKLAKEGAFRHSGTPGLGENLFWSSKTSPANATELLQAAVDSWYGEVEDYKGHWTGSPVVGHFTQVVWKASTSVGFGIATALRDGTWQDAHVVANYKPQGNINVESEELQNNVEAKAGDANQCKTPVKKDPEHSSTSSTSITSITSSISITSSTSSARSTKQVPMIIGILPLSPLVFSINAKFQVTHLL